MNASQFAYVIVIGLTGFSGLAIAFEDTKVYPGAMCKPADSAADFRIGSSGSILFDSPTNIICPVITDSIGTLNDIERASISVEAGDDGTFSDCTLYTVDGDNRPIGVVSSSLVDVDDEVRQFRFGDGSANIPTAFAGTALFICRMLEGSGILSYSITENIAEN